MHARTLIVVVSTLLAGQLAPRATWAASPAEALIAKAAEAYGKADYGAASQLYESAWKLRRSQTRLLYNAARTAHLARKPERAEALYRQFMALPERDAKAEQKARAYLRDLDTGRAESKAEQARRAADTGKPGLAAMLYAAAARLAPHRPVYRYRAGESALLAGRKAEARAHFEAYVASKNAEPATRAQARGHLARLGGAQPPPPASAPQVTRTHGGVAGGGVAWGAVALGVVGLALGGVATWQGLAARDGATRLEGQLAKTEPKGQISGTTYAAAVADNEAIARQRTVAWATGITGALAVAAGVLWWQRHEADPSVALGLHPGGASLQVAF